MNDQLREEEEIIYRLSREPSKWCELCNVFTSHLTEGHEAVELANESEGRAVIAEARITLAKDRKQVQ